MVIERTLSKLFVMEEINGHGACPTYLFRWILFHCPKFAVYIHKFVGDDWSKDLHDHPKRFWSIGLWGRYREHYWPGGPWSGNIVCTRDYQAPWIRTFPAEHRHRIIADPAHPCWTLVITGPTVRIWGFWYHYALGRVMFYPWKDYVSNLDIREEVKTCV